MFLLYPALQCGFTFWCDVCLSIFLVGFFTFFCTAVSHGTSLLLCLCRQRSLACIQLHNHTLQKVLFQSDSFWNVSRPLKRARLSRIGIFKRAEYITEFFPKILNYWLRFICHVVAVAHYNCSNSAGASPCPH
jgi:hypothetical protein